MLIWGWDDVILGVRILFVFDMIHPDCPTFPHQIGNIFSHFSVIQIIQPVIEFVGGSFSKSASLPLIQLDSKPTGQSASQIVRHLLFSFAVTYQSLHSDAVGCGTAPLCRKKSSWPTWQQAAGNLSEYRQPDWLIQRHACTHTGPQLFVLDRLEVEGRRRCFPALVSLWLRQRAEGKGEVLSCGLWMNSFPPHENIQRQEDRGRGGMDVGQDSVTHSTRRGFSKQT